ncbi:NUDIX hydrolase [Bacillus cihuensis]|nr:hypothetical protein [Bacillus cihuensis]
MKETFGSAAVCINEKNEILMVSGYDSEYCIREVKGETGYEV